MAAEQLRDPAGVLKDTRITGRLEEMDFRTKNEAPPVARAPCGANRRCAYGFSVLTLGRWAISVRSIGDFAKVLALVEGAGGPFWGIGKPPDGARNDK